MRPNVNSAFLQDVLMRLILLITFLTCAGAFSLFVEGGARPQGIYNEGNVSGLEKYVNYYYLIFIIFLPAYLLLAKKIVSSFKGFYRYSGFYLSLVVVFFSVMQWVNGSEFTAGGVGSIMSLTGLGLILYLLTSIMSTEEIFKYLNKVYLICFVSSIGLALLVPGYGITYYEDGAWQGIFNHKNNLGLFCASYAISSPSFLKESKKLTIINIIIAMLLVIKSNSYTGTIAFFVGIIFCLAPRRLRSFLIKFKKSFIAAGVLLSGALVFLSISNFAFKIIDKDFSFSGRNAIWSYSLLKIWEHPFIGQGMNSMAYQVTNNPTEFYNATGQVLANEHNGFIGTIYNFGILGFLVIISVMMVDIVSIGPERKYAYGFLVFIMCLITINTFEERSIYANLFYFWYLIYSRSINVIENRRLSRQLTIT